MTDPTIAAAVADATTEIAAEAAAAVVTPPAAADPPADAPAAEADAAPAEGTEAPPKPDPVKTRMANLNRKYADTDRAREAAERRAEAAEALLAASRTEDPAKPATPPPRPATTATDIEAAAARLLADREANQTRQKVIDAGVKQFGREDWDNRAAVLAEFGATSNPGFMDALLEAENPTAIVAALTDDTGALDDLMKKAPAAIGTALGRMDAGFSKPTGKPISQAPKPAAKVDPGGNAPEMDIYNYPPGLSMKEFNKIADAVLPVHLGGKRKVA